MKKKDAFIRAIAHQDVFPVPYSVKFTVEAKEKLLGYLGKEVDLTGFTGSYVVASHTNNGWKEVKPGFYQDYFGIVWNKTVDKTLGIVDYPPLRKASFDGYTFPDPENIPVYKFINENIRNYPDLFHMVSIGFSLFERGWSLTGMENLMLYLMLEPAFVHDMFAKITEYNIGVIRRSAELGVDCVHVGDDWGTQNGLLVGIDMWREFVKPYFHKTCQAAREAGLLVSLHCCGKVDELIPEMIECGVNVFDPFQPEVMDIWHLREQYRNKIAFWGGLSVQQLMPYGSVEDVKKESKRLLELMAPGGGYIFAPSHSLTGDIPVQNILAFLEMAQGGEKSVQ
jgi:uroporphyrinogen decarboxylase